MILGSQHRLYRRAVRIVSLVTVVAVLLVASALVALRVRYPQDEGGFLHQVHRSVWDKESKGWVFDGADDTFLMAEGYKACDWLGDQPVAWWRQGGEWSNAALLTRYLDEAAVVRGDWSFGGGDLQLKREVVAAKAWLRLCGASMELREPHNPFS